MYLLRGNQRCSPHRVEYLLLAKGDSRVAQMILNGSRRCSSFCTLISARQATSRPPIWLDISQVLVGSRSELGFPLRNMRIFDLVSLHTLVSSTTVSSLSGAHRCRTESDDMQPGRLHTSWMSDVIFQLVWCVPTCELEGIASEACLVSSRSSSNTGVTSYYARGV